MTGVDALLFIPPMPCQTAYIFIIAFLALVFMFLSLPCKTVSIMCLLCVYLSLIC